MLNSAQLTSVANEVNNDPAGVGYAQYVTAKDPASIAALGNDQTKATVPRPGIKRDDLLLMLVPVVQALSQASATTQATFNPMLNVLRSVSGVMLDASTKGVLQSLVSANLMTQALYDSIINRPGSRFEAVLGPDIVVSTLDVATAIWGANR